MAAPTHLGHKQGLQGLGFRVEGLGFNSVNPKRHIVCETGLNKPFLA